MRTYIEARSTHGAAATRSLHYAKFRRMDADAGPSNKAPRLAPYYGALLDLRTIIVKIFLSVAFECAPPRGASKGAETRCGGGWIYD